MKLDTAIFVAVNTKGGVGKSTASGQFIVPFLVESLGLGEQGVKFYEVDDENNTKQALECSTLTDPVLVKNGDRALHEICIKEFESFTRDYPIVFDVGVAYAHSAIETISMSRGDEEIIYVIPLKQDESDYTNSMAVIEEIKAHDKKAKFIIVCSDSVCGFNAETERDLKEEFGYVFGVFVNPRNKKHVMSLFETVNIPQRFVAIKKTPLLYESKLYGITLYEAAKIGRSLHSSDGDLHPNAKKQDELRQKAEKLKSAGVKTKKEQDELASIEEERRALARELSFYKQCTKYWDQWVQPLYREFGRML